MIQLPQIYVPSREIILPRHRRRQLQRAHAYTGGIGVVAGSRRRSGSVTPAHKAAVLADGPLAFWELNDAAPSGSGSVLDSSGNANHATPNGGITWAQPGCLADDSGAAALLNGSSGYISGGTSLAATLMNSAAWTIELWFFSGTASGTLFAAASDSTHRVRIEYTYGGVGSDRIFTSSSVGGNKSSHTSGFALVKNNWHHVVLTSAGDLYVDGVVMTSTSSSTLNSTVGLIIGALNTGTSAWFSGRISCVAIYQSALTSTRVLAHRAAAYTHDVPAGLTFELVGDSLTPSIFPPGSDDVGQLDGGATLVSDGDGNWIEVGGAPWRSMTFDNPTPQTQWASPDEGTIRGQFKCSDATFAAWMLAQITGKDRSLQDDTNQGVAIKLSSTGFTSIYTHAGGSRTASGTVTLLPDTIYDFELKWRSSGSPYLSATINGVTATSTTAGEVGNVTCDTWHHLLWGSDVDVTPDPTSLKIRNLKTYSIWQ